jgi:hypothetical protein
MTILPSSCAGKLDNEPLKEPTGVRTALAIIIASCPSIDFLPFEHWMKKEFSSVNLRPEWLNSRRGMPDGAAPTGAPSQCSRAMKTA